MSEARDAILTKLRRNLPREARAQDEAVAAVAARLKARRPNLVPKRGQLEPEARIELFTTMARNV
jgi:hypothetical protein